MTTDFPALVARLTDSGVEFIIIGGVAGAIHGAGRATFDLDVVYHRTPENIMRVVRAMSGLCPYPRGAPPGLPFTFDDRTIGMGFNFTLNTSLGLIDLLERSLREVRTTLCCHSRKSTRCWGENAVTWRWTS